MKTLKILYDNIFWKAMSAKQNICPLTSTDNTICASNIVNFITEKKMIMIFFVYKKLLKK